VTDNNAVADTRQSSQSKEHTHCHYSTHHSSRRQTHSHQILSNGR